MRWGSYSMEIKEIINQETIDAILAYDLLDTDVLKVLDAKNLFIEYDNVRYIYQQDGIQLRKVTCYKIGTGINNERG